MFALTKLWQSAGTLAANVAALAETVAAVNDGLRRWVGLDGSDPLDTPTLTHLPSPDPTEGGETASGPSKRPRGRRKGTEPA
jgi:hypothetical protein